MRSVGDDWRRRGQLASPGTTGVAGEVRRRKHAQPAMRASERIDTWEESQEGRWPVERGAGPTAHKHEGVPAGRGAHRVRSQ